MKRRGWLGVLLLGLVAGGPGFCADPQCCPPPQERFCQRLAPVGGWMPYGGGLLRWWNPCCFPHGGAPDDYCRKPLPKVCRPSYPPFYTWGPPEICNPCGGCGPASAGCK